MLGVLTALDLVLVIPSKVCVWGGEQSVGLLSDRLGLLNSSVNSGNHFSSRVSGSY